MHSFWSYLSIPVSVSLWRLGSINSDFTASYGSFEYPGTNLVDFEKNWPYEKFAPVAKNLIPVCLLIGFLTCWSSFKPLKLRFQNELLLVLYTAAALRLVTYQHAVYTNETLRSTVCRDNIYTTDGVAVWVAFCGVMNIVNIFTDSIPGEKLWNTHLVTTAAVGTTLYALKQSGGAWFFTLSCLLTFVQLFSKVMKENYGDCGFLKAVTSRIDQLFVFLQCAQILALAEQMRLLHSWRKDGDCGAGDERVLAALSLILAGYLVVYGNWLVNWFYKQCAIFKEKLDKGSEQYQAKKDE